MPALAIAEALRAKRPDLEPVLVGAHRGIEAQLLPPATSGTISSIEPLYRRQWWKNFRLPLVALKVRNELAQIFDAERPALVLGTGGTRRRRRSVPRAITRPRSRSRMPGPGSATPALGRVNEVYLGLPEAKPHLKLGPSTKCYDTGNRSPRPTAARREAARAKYHLLADDKVLLVTGASQGAGSAINRAIAGGSKRMVRGTGSDLVDGAGSYDEFKSWHRAPVVQVFPFIDPMADAYAVADLAVARGGMMTGAELCAWGIPSVIIPLPSAAPTTRPRTPSRSRCGSGGAPCRRRN